MKVKERYFGFGLLALAVLLGRFLLTSDMLFFRLLAGMGLGYTLSRGYTGFAGSVNRAYRTGSTRLMRAMMLMFFVTAVLNAAFLFKAEDIKTYDLWINPINAGLLLGGLLFGFGMAFSSCCASGVLTDIVTSLPRALVTLLFFCFGVFIGFPLQNTQSWIIDSWFSSQTGRDLGLNGVYLPDLFGGDGLGGYLGAILLTGLFCVIVTVFAYKYEKKRKLDGSYTGHFMENIQETEAREAETDSKKYAFWSEETYERVFAKSWSLKKAGMVLAGIFTLLMGVTRAGWGASTPYGFWFGRILVAFGVNPGAIAEFTHMPEKVYVMPFFEHPINVQNFGILVGTAIFLLTAEVFGKTFTSELKITGKQALFYGLGGFLMGFGTRLSNGCNVGALYTPIANFSLSGWIFFLVLVAGGILGNMLAKKVKL